MMKKNKKALIFSFGLALVLLIALTRVYFLFKSNQADLNGKFAVGTNQINVLASIQNAEKALIYGDEELSLAFQQSLYDASWKGGFDGAPSCGEYRGYAVWRKNETYSCYPALDNVKENIAKSTLGSLNAYLLKSQFAADGTVYKNNHEIFLEQKGSKLIARAYSFGVAENPITCVYGEPPSIYNLGIGSLSKGMCGKYYYKPSFRKDIQFNINDFNTAVSGAKSISENAEACEKAGKPLQSCIEQAVNGLNSAGTVKFSLCERLAGISRSVIVCADTGNKLLAKNPQTGALALENAMIKFVLMFPEKEAEPSASSSAEIEFEEDSFLVMNIHYQFRDGEWKWRCPGTFCGYTTFRSLDSSAVSLMSSQFQDITNGLKSYSKDYENGAQWIQSKVNEDSDAYLIIHYTGSCTVTTTDEKKIDNLAELARSPDSPPAGSSCD